MFDMFARTFYVSFIVLGVYSAMYLFESIGVL